MNKFINITIFLVLLFMLSCETPPPQQITSPPAKATRQPQYDGQPQAPASLYFTGNGGRGISLAILAPQATGLAENQSYLPSLVQGEFVSNFSGFSAISVLDRERLDEQYAELLSGYYDDNAEAGLDLGHLTPTDYIMGGNITRTSTGYALQMHITKTADKMTTASYSGTCTFEELDNLTGIRRVSHELLQKMGVTLTAKAQEELAGAATDNHIIAQTALARGIVAQRQGTEVAALSYYFQAVAFDPSLLEAANRSSILNANISSGNIGFDVRNDIAWRRQWVERLTETEQYFDSFNRTESMPYTLFYISDEIKQGAINYQTETVSLSIETHLHGSGIWTLSIERALQAVYDGLEATGRRSTWGLASWPRQGVTNLNAFSRRSNNFSVVFELLNEQNKVLGRQTLQSGGSWELNWSGRPVVNVSADVRRTVNFQNVNANDITDRMIIRITTVNGIDAEIAARNGVLQIRAVNKNIFDANDRFRYARGEIQGFANNAARVAELVIPNTIWGDPVISVGNGAFFGSGLTSVTIPECFIAIGNEAFRNNKLNHVTINNNASVGTNAFSGNLSNAGNFEVSLSDDGRSVSITNYTGNPNVQIPPKIQGMPVIGISERAFANKQLTRVTIPNGVLSIGNEAFRGNWITNITIPESVRSIGSRAFSENGYEPHRAIPSLQGTMSITIGANVVMERNPFPITYNSSLGLTPIFTTNDAFLNFYYQNGRRAGTYTFPGGKRSDWRWTYSP